MDPLRAAQVELEERQRWRAYLRSAGCRRPSLNLFDVLFSACRGNGGRWTQHPQGWVQSQLGLKNRSSVYRMEYRLARLHAVLIGRRRRGPSLGSARVVLIPRLDGDLAAHLPKRDFLALSEQGYIFDGWAVSPWLVHRCDAVLGSPFGV